jgi:hypothetical protein
MTDQVKNPLDEKEPITDVETNQAEKDKAIAIDSAKPKSPADVVEPAA